MRASTMVVTLALTLYWVDAMIADIARLWWGPLAVNYLTMLCIWGTMYCMDSIATPFMQEEIGWHHQVAIIAWGSVSSRPSHMTVLGLDRLAS